VNPFYSMAPGWFQYPLLILSTLATIIASQAVISGLFSVVWQASQLNYLPKIRTIKLSGAKAGNIYMPFINYLTMFAVIALVLFFKSSSNLADAYGLSVNGIMVITSSLAIILAKAKWNWPWWKLIFVWSVLFTIDLILLLSNISKFLLGGWMTVLVALVVYVVIKAWRYGNNKRKLSRQGDGLENLSFKLKENKVINQSQVLNGCGIFLGRSSREIPRSFLTYLSHIPVLQKTVFFLSIKTVSLPKVKYHERFTLVKINTNSEENLNCNFYQIIARYGFKEHIDLNLVFDFLQDVFKDFDKEKTNFFGQRVFITHESQSYLFDWKENLYSFLARNAQHSSNYFEIPNNKMIQLCTILKV